MINSWMSGSYGTLFVSYREFCSFKEGIFTGLDIPIILICPHFSYKFGI
jgi:hypothetical protein